MIFENNPHYVAHCRCLREVVACEGWNGDGDPVVDRLYDQMEFHWDHMNGDEREAAWSLSAELSNGEDTMSKNEVCKGRWGFYPCDYETYVKIKQLHMWYCQELRDWANWCRWQRKEPQNRVIRKYTRDALGRKVDYEIVGPRPEPVICPCFHKDGRATTWRAPDEFGIVEAYRNARYPVGQEKNVKPFSDSDLSFLLNFYDEVSAWYESRQKAA